MRKNEIARDVSAGTELTYDQALRFAGMTKLELCREIARRAGEVINLGTRFNQEKAKREMAHEMFDRQKMHSDNLESQLRTMNRVCRILRTALGRTNSQAVVEHFSSALFDVLRDEDDLARQRNVPAVSDLMRGDTNA